VYLTNRNLNKNLKKKRKNKVSGKLSHDPVIALLGIYAKDMKAVLASAAHILKT